MSAEEMGKQLTGCYCQIIWCEGEGEVKDCTKVLQMGAWVLVPSRDANNSGEWTICREQM